MEDAGKVIPADSHGVARAQLFCAPATVGVDCLVETNVVVRAVFDVGLIVGQLAVFAKRIQRLGAGELAQRAHDHFAVIRQYGGQLVQRGAVLGNDAQVGALAFRQGVSFF